MAENQTSIPTTGKQDFDEQAFSKELDKACGRGKGKRHTETPQAPAPRKNGLSAEEEKELAEFNASLDAVPSYVPPVKPSPEKQTPKPSSASKFVFHPLSDVENAPLPKWLVKGIIIDGGVGQIYGESGAGKSFLCIDLGMHVAHGWTWYGHKTIRRPVRYLVLEGSQGFMLRLRAYKQWAKVYGNTPSQVIDGDFQYYTGDLSLMNEREVKELAKVIPQGALVFIDTQAQATAGLQENSSELGKAIANAQLLARLAHCTVCLVHHKGKNQSNGSRGWSGQQAAWDFEIELTGKGKGVRTWKVTKSKDGPEGEAHGYSLALIHIQGADGHALYDDDGDAVTSCVSKPEELPDGYEKLSPAVSFALNTLAEAIIGEASPDVSETSLTSLNDSGETETVSVEKWREIFYEKHEGDTANAKKQAFWKARNTLKNAGFAVVHGYKWCLTEQGVSNVSKRL